ncbi:MAG: NAD-dependent epimerase/dehydratase family protein [Acidimicrobiales bacterium]
MNVFVAGATGVLGRATVPRLVAAGHDVVGVARTEAKADQLRAQGARPVTVDLFDPVAVRRSLEGCDAVVHMATSIPMMTRAMGPKAWAENDRLRREGTRIMAEAAADAGVTVFVKETVCFFYPDRGDERITEDVPTERAAFSAATLDAEDTVEGFTASGRRGVVLRFGLFYSADARSTEENLKMARFGLGPMIGRAEAYQPSIHVDDAAAAVVAALDAPAGTYNVADEPITKREWNDAFAAAFGTRRLRSTPKLVLALGGKKVGVLAASRRVSSDHFRRATGWAPTFPDATVGLAHVAAQQQADVA